MPSEPDCESRISQLHLGSPAIGQFYLGVVFTSNCLFSSGFTRPYLPRLCSVCGILPCLCSALGITKETLKAAQYFHPKLKTSNPSTDEYPQKLIPCDGRSPCLPLHPVSNTGGFGGCRNRHISSHEPHGCTNPLPLTCDAHPTDSAHSLTSSTIVSSARGTHPSRVGRIVRSHRRLSK